MSIDIENIRKRFGNAEVLSDINLKIASGEMIALLGPSGSGKTDASARFGLQSGKNAQERRFA